MYIFNRWGEIIFETNDIDIGWNGTYDGNIVQLGVYTYLIAFRDITSPFQKSRKGFVTVVR
jgi:gliding motility-associated-like protein